MFKALRRILIVRNFDPKTSTTVNLAIRDFWLLVVPANNKIHFVRLLTIRMDIVLHVGLDSRL